MSTLDYKSVISQQAIRDCGLIWPKKIQPDKPKIRPDPARPTGAAFYALFRLYHL